MPAIVSKVASFPGSSLFLVEPSQTQGTARGNRHLFPAMLGSALLLAGAVLFSYIDPEGGALFNTGESVLYTPAR